MNWFVLLYIKWTVDHFFVLFFMHLSTKTYVLPMFLESEKIYNVILCWILTNKNEGKHKGKIDLKNIYYITNIVFQQFFF